MSKLKVGDVVAYNMTKYIILQMLGDIVIQVKKCHSGNIINAIPTDRWKNVDWKLVKRAKQRKFI